MKQNSIFSKKVAIALPFVLIALWIMGIYSHNLLTFVWIQRIILLCSAFLFSVVAYNSCLDSRMRLSAFIGIIGSVMGCIAWYYMFKMDNFSNAKAHYTWLYFYSMALYILSIIITHVKPFIKSGLKIGIIILYCWFAIGIVSAINNSYQFFRFSAFLNLIALYYYLWFQVTKRGDSSIFLQEMQQSISITWLSKILNKIPHLHRPTRKQIVISSSIIGVVAIIVVIISLPTATERRVQQREKEGKHIVTIHSEKKWQKLPYIFYYTETGLYKEDVKSEQTQLVLDFSKEYMPHYFRMHYEDGQKELCINEYECEYLDDIIQFSSGTSYYIDAYDDYVLHVSYGGEDYIVFNSQPDVFYRGELIVDTSGKVLYRYKGNLWCEYGEYSQDPKPDFPTRYISEELIQLWYSQSAFLPMDIFDYWVDLEFINIGTVSTRNIDVFHFNKIDKTYSVQDMLNNYELKDFAEIMEEEFKKYFIKKIKDECVYPSDMVNDFETNQTKAQKKYPEKKKMFINTTLDKIEQSDKHGYKYCVTYQANMLTTFSFYTNDEAFVELDYPCSAYVGGIFNGYYVDWGIFSNDYIYSFNDVVFLMQ